MKGDDLARAAEALTGAPFRLHGRDPATGLDCIGVLAAALSGAGASAQAIPNGYRLRRRALPDLGRFAAATGFTPAGGAVVPGDVLILRPGPCQFHLAITACDGRLVHADAGLARVVTVRAPLPWPVVSHWRLAEPD